MFIVAPASATPAQIPFPDQYVRRFDATPFAGLFAAFAGFRFLAPLAAESGASLALGKGFP